MKMMRKQCAAGRGTLVAMAMLLIAHSSWGCHRRSPLDDKLVEATSRNNRSCVERLLGQGGNVDARGVKRRP